MTSAEIGGLAAVNLPNLSEGMFDSSVRVSKMSNISSTRSGLDWSRQEAHEHTRQ